MMTFVQKIYVSIPLAMGTFGVQRPEARGTKGFYSQVFEVVEVSKQEAPEVDSEVIGKCVKIIENPIESCWTI